MELLVEIAIIGILIAVLMPAVQMVRGVELKDMIAAESGRDEEPTPSRFHVNFSKIAVTPLKYEVSSGPRQAFEIDLPLEDE